MATHFSILAWEIPQTEEPLVPKVLRVGHNLWPNLHHHLPHTCHNPLPQETICSVSALGDHITIQHKEGGLDRYAGSGLGKQHKSLRNYKNNSDNRFLPNVKLQILSSFVRILRCEIAEQVPSCTKYRLWENLKSESAVLCLVPQLCLTLWDPMDCKPQIPLSMGILQARLLGVGCHALLQGIFPTQRSNPVLTCCRQILYRLKSECLEFKTQFCHSPAAPSKLLSSATLGTLILKRRYLLQRVIVKIKLGQAL